MSEDTATDTGSKIERIKTLLLGSADTATKLLDAVDEARDVLGLLEDEINSIEAIREDGDGPALLEALNTTPLRDSTTLLNNVIRRYYAAYNDYKAANAMNE